MMVRIRKKIETIITGNRKDRLFSFGSFLFMISLVYGGIVKLREFCYKTGLLKSKRLPCAVISIGNITVGGTGKTPMAIKVAQIIRRLGYKVAIISRGYKGGAEKTGGIVSNGHTIFMEPEKAGDEPFMMASKLKDIPVVVGQNRFEAGRLAIQEFNPDVIVLDDAFQHLNLKRDIDIVLLDCGRPLGNAHLLPRGILRETISALKRSDAFVLTRFDSVSDYIRQATMDKIEPQKRAHSPQSAKALWRTGLASESENSKVPYGRRFPAACCGELQNLAPGRPVFRSFHVPNLYKPVNDKKSMPGIELQNFDYGLLHGRRVVAFSGLAGNNDFRRTVESLKCDLIDFFEFPDHHKYTKMDLQAIIQSSINAQAEFILTTEKDYVRIPGKTSWPVELVVVGIELSLGDDENAFIDFIKNRLEEIVE
ncbi:MAG: tetraacyldisaccharide 4'-kinase [Desulfobacterales bacterium]|uniref:Tetraacyldisaccharide 4'-kinase n=1 Tax=Candidatus Desulfaltia bathyphila TaxID=2841697 RepID=A0A8J6N5K9_9BACT|nr:tetraacyldisaccharide 4'-kinase [Candidatus Desulfaltia bathyphila]MBL7207592.1 tetraacyldisaccharide 4'-kinase [Desulfobacterales bacterium]